MFRQESLERGATKNTSFIDYKGASLWMSGPCIMTDEVKTRRRQLTVAKGPAAPTFHYELISLLIAPTVN
jgi:hypothetical protein